MNCLLTYDRKQDPVDPDPVVPMADPKEDLEEDLAITLPNFCRKGQHAPVSKVKRDLTME